MSHNIVPIKPFNKAELKKIINDKQVQERMYCIKVDVQYIYNETIKAAVNGLTKYIFSLGNHRYLQMNKIYIQELIRELYYVFPDLTIQYDTKKLYDLQDIETIVPCIILEWE